MFDLGAVAALPDVLLRPDAIPTDRRPRLVATGYGGSVRASFSGSTAYLAEAGISEGSLDGAFTLYSTSPRDRRLELEGAAWKLRQILRRESTSGFKFSERFSAHVWQRHLPALAGTDIISNFQLYSSGFFKRRSEFDVRAFFYLDGTLHDYLLGYREHDVAIIDPATADRAIAVERRGYQQVDGIAVMSEFTARTLTQEYGVRRDRITVVLPGANLSDVMAARVVTARAARPPTEEVTVGFVGVYPERKGLPKLAAAVAALRLAKVPVRLLVVGRCPEEIARMDGVEALGFVSKTGDPDRFVDALSRVDLGCQLSTAELFGIAVLEFFRCGIPVLATEVGGVTDVLAGGGGLGVPGEISVEGVADEIRRFVEDESLRRRLSHDAAGRSDGVRWQHTAASLGRFVASRTAP